MVDSNWLRWHSRASTLEALESRRVLDVVGQVGLPQQQSLGRWGARPSSGKKWGSRAATRASRVRKPAARWSGWSRYRRQGSWPRSTSGRTGRMIPATARRSSVTSFPAPRRPGRGRSTRSGPDGGGPDRRRSTAAAARHSSARAATSASEVGAGLPAALRPVGEHEVVDAGTRPAAHLARVAPHPNSMSSGWAPTARARRVASAGPAVIGSECRAGRRIRKPARLPRRDAPGSSRPVRACGRCHRADADRGGDRTGHHVARLVDVPGQVGKVEHPQREAEPFGLGPVAGERTRAVGERKPASVGQRHHVGAVAVPVGDQGDARRRPHVRRVRWPGAGRHGPRSPG